MILFNDLSLFKCRGRHSTFLIVGSSGREIGSDLVLGTGEGAVEYQICFEKVYDVLL